VFPVFYGKASLTVLIVKPGNVSCHEPDRYVPHTQSLPFNFNFQVLFSKWRKPNTRFFMSVCMSVCLSARMEQLGFYWKDLYEIWYLSIFRKSVQQIQVSLKSTRITNVLHDYLCTYVIISLWILVTMQNASDKICSENQNTHLMFYNFFFLQSYCVCDNAEKHGGVRQATDENITQRMRFACWITTATDTHSEYVILISFPLQQWLREGAAIFRYTFIACLFSCPSTYIWL
jgi:hypothetical protein